MRLCICNGINSEHCLRLHKLDPEFCPHLIPHEYDEDECYEGDCYDPDTDKYMTVRCMEEFLDKNEVEI